MIVGVDIGGTKIAAAGFTLMGGGEVHRSTAVQTVPTPGRQGGAAIVETVARLVDRIRDGISLEGVGVGTAGVVGDAGEIVSATAAISGWAGYPLRAELERFLGASVVTVNDVHAAAVAEAARRDSHDGSGLLMVAVGTGIGGATILRDGLHRGYTGTAGSVGHIEVALPPDLAERRCPCGGFGHVEAVASGPGMEQTYAQATGTALSLRAISAAASRGDLQAQRVISDGARHLGRALGSANALLDVGTIVIGGGVAEIGSVYMAQVEAAYREASIPGPSNARVIPAALGIEATLTGAASLAVDQLSSTENDRGSPPLHRA